MPSLMASIAGLPATKACVRVGPPLLAKVVLRIALSTVGRLPSEVAVMSVEPGVKLSKAWRDKNRLMPLTRRDLIRNTAKTKGISF